MKRSIILHMKPTDMCLFVTNLLKPGHNLICDVRKTIRDIQFCKRPSCKNADRVLIDIKIQEIDQNLTILIP